jgi:cell wall-associated NlpC family hydrolase
METVGTLIDVDSALRAGDLLFWKGHVAMAVSSDRMIHATAFHMAVMEEPIDATCARILEMGDGPVLARKRFVVP